VPDTRVPVKSGIAEKIFQVAELALTATHLYFIVMEDCHPG